MSTVRPIVPSPRHDFRPGSLRPPEDGGSRSLRGADGDGSGRRRGCGLQDPDP
ncbi:hypothetical protein chiPu_0028083, partial [Chiloscyllium punctatum]|nr:hypothetical protein [Chiloscyllium punctatum]